MNKTPRYIDANRLIDDVMEAKKDYQKTNSDTALHDLICDNVFAWVDSAPTIQPESVKCGHWIEYPKPHYFKCSICKYTVPYKRAMFVLGKREYNYCPHCGAFITD